MTTLSFAPLVAFGLIGCAHQANPKNASAQAQMTQVAAPAQPTYTEADQISVQNSIHRIYFNSASAALGPDDKAALDADIALLQRWPMVQIMIQGHTDEKGGLTYNLNLGEDRAANVRKYLVDHGIDLSRVIIVSQGEDESEVGDADTPKELAGDRRTDFILLWETPESGQADNAK